MASASVCYCNLSPRCAVLAVKVAGQYIQATVAGPCCVRGAVRLAVLPLPLLPAWPTEKVCWELFVEGNHVYLVLIDIADGTTCAA